MKIVHGRFFAHLCLIGIAISIWIGAIGGAFWRGPTPTYAIPLEPITYTGESSLRQSDGSGCHFSDAPFTSGTFTLQSDWVAGTATGSLTGAGNGVRSGLRCGNTTGTMHWRQSYAATFSGTADAASGGLTLNGTLSGSDFVHWENCRTDGEPVECTGDSSDNYTFPITLDGTIATVAGTGSGSWRVENIPLTSVGQWQVTGPALTPTPTETETATATATPTSTPTATPTPRLDLTVKNVEIVQSIQCLQQSEGDTSCPDNSVELVSYKQTALRVYVGLADTPQEPADGVGAELRGYRNNQELVGSPLTPINDRIRALNLPNRANDQETLNFRLPHEWLTGNIDLEIEVNPRQTIPEQNYLNNTRRLSLSFAELPFFRIAYVPITYRGSAPSSAIHSAHQLLSKLLPVGYGRMTYTPWPGFAWDQPITNDNPTALLAELRRRYLLSNYPVDQVAGWLPSGLGISILGISDPLWSCWFGCSGVGRVSWQVVTSDLDFTLAHEIGHNLGRRHTNLSDGCRAVDGSTDWPYATSTIQEVGYDAATMQVISNQTFDLMTYCSPPTSQIWVSPFTYKKLLAGRLQPRHYTRGQPTPYLLVSGQLYASGGGELQSTYHFTSTRSFDLTSTGNDACLALQNDAQETLATYCFSTEFHDHRTGQEMAELSFALVLPNPVNATRVVLIQKSQPLAILAASAHAPTLAFTAPSSGSSVQGATTVRWQAHDEDGDALTYALLYSSDNKASWLTLASTLTETTFLLNSNELAGGEQAYLRLIASDGFQTSQIDSVAFAVPRKGPQPLIFSPKSGDEHPAAQPLLLTGDGYDLEDQSLPDEAFRWFSDRAGLLGIGRTIMIDQLASGVHQLTLQLTDSEANQRTAQIQITIQPTSTLLFLPVVNKGEK